MSHTEVILSIWKKENFAIENYMNCYFAASNKASFSINVIWKSPLSFLGALGVYFIFFYLIFSMKFLCANRAAPDGTPCPHIWGYSVCLCPFCHIWGYSVCLCPTKGTLGLNELICHLP